MVGGAASRDQRGLAALLQAFLERSRVAAPENFERARIMYVYQIGYYALSISESRAERTRLAPSIRSAERFARARRDGSGAPRACPAQG